MSEFHIGQQVLCVNGRPRRGLKHLHWPRTGSRYRVRAYVPSEVAGRIPCVLLQEIRNPRVIYAACNSGPRLYEAGFAESRFVAATDITELQKLQTVASHKIRETEDA